MEMIDILNPDGSPTGKCAERQQIHALGLWHRTVHIWIRNQAGELLLQKRSLTKDTHPGLWDISCAGHLSAGDSATEGALREAREELGVQLDREKLRHLFTLKQHWKSPDGCIIENEIKEVFLYTGPVEIADVNFDTGEVSGVMFFLLSDLKTQMAAHPEFFVPHEEEYTRLFAIIDQQQTI